MSAEVRTRDYYFNWLCSKIDDGRGRNYAILLLKMFQTPFKVVVKKDENRVADGLALRDWFYEETGRGQYGSGIPCSVLEVLIALARRCEVEIMGEYEEDNTGKWFWMMVENIGLLPYDNAHFDNDSVAHFLAHFLDRKWARGGQSGPFPLKTAKFDSRKQELWFLMCHWLDENFVKSDII